MEVRRKIEEEERKRLEQADKILALKLQVSFIDCILYSTSC